MGDELGVRGVHGRLLFAHALLAFVPYMAGKRLRAQIYRAAGFSIGPKTVIYGKLRVWGGGNIYKRLHIGASCRINTPCAFELDGPITLGDRVVIGSGTTLITTVHDMASPDCRAGTFRVLPIVIENGAWLAANVTVLPGVTIGAGAVVGAGSVVTRDIPPHVLAAGNPARVVRDLPR